MTFLVGRETLRLLPARLYYVDFARLHSVHNGGTEPRIHMILDLLVNDFLERVFPEPTPTERAERFLIRNTLPLAWPLFRAHFALGQWFQRSAPQASTRVGREPGRVSSPLIGCPAMSIDFKLRDFCYPVSILRLGRAVRAQSVVLSGELIREQERRLRQIVAHAYQNVPYYRDTFRALGLTPTDVRTALRPDQAPDALQGEPPGHFSDLQAVNRARFHPRAASTSGTSGEPARFLLDKHANVLEFVVLLAALELGGIPAGRPVRRTLQPRLPPGGITSSADRTCSRE